MPRPIDYWYQLIINEKNNQTIIKDTLLPDSASSDNLALLLSELQSESKVAIWRLFAFIVASTNWVLDSFFDLFKKDIQTIADTAYVGSRQWLADKARDFQLGDILQTLTAENGIKYLGYVEIKPENDLTRIVKLVAVENQNLICILKIASLSGLTPVKITGIGGLNQFRFYINQIQPVGTNILIVSEDADLVKYEMDIYYNGLLDLFDCKTAVELAINTYHTQLQFNGELQLSALGDAIQATTLPTLEKVVNGYEIKNAQAKSSNGIYAQFTEIYETYAGYVEIDPLFPLATTINYIPK